MAPNRFNGTGPRTKSFFASFFSKKDGLTSSRATASVEFALVGLAITAFILIIVNVSLFGLSLGALVRGVQAAARNAAVHTAAAYATTNAITCPTQAAIVGYFNAAANPPLPPATGTNGNPTVTATWTDNGADTIATDPPGLYLTLTGSYRFVPIGFAPFGAGITLRITTVATVTGSSQLASSC